MRWLALVVLGHLLIFGISLIAPLVLVGRWECERAQFSCIWSGLDRVWILVGTVSCIGEGEVLCAFVGGAWTMNWLNKRCHCWLFLIV